MKKKLVAIAIAAACVPAAAMADVTIYGKVNASVEHNSGLTTTAASKQNGMEINSHNSRIGFKGTESLGDGLSAIFQIESGLNLTGSGNAGGVFAAARDSFIGLSGEFGTVRLGRVALGNQYAFDATFFAEQIGDATNFTGAGVGANARVSNSIDYATPKMGALSGLITYAPNYSHSTGNAPANPNGKDSAYALRGVYADGDLTAALSYQNMPSAAGAAGAPDHKITSLGGKYNFGSGAIGLQYVRATDIGSTAGADRNVYTLGGSYKISGNSAIKAQYSNAGDLSTAPNTGATSFALGYDYSFSKRTTGYIAYAKTTNEAAGTFRANGGWGSHTSSTTVTTAGDDPSAISIGLAHTF